MLIGQDAPLLAATLADAGIPHTMAGTLDAAVPLAAAAARRLDVPVVLLSPACASFDQFTGFEARGDRFAALAATQHMPACQMPTRQMPTRQMQGAA